MTLCDRFLGYPDCVLGIERFLSHTDVELGGVWNC